MSTVLVMLLYCYFQIDIKLFYFIVTVSWCWCVGLKYFMYDLFSLLMILAALQMMLRFLPKSLLDARWSLISAPTPSLLPIHKTIGNAWYLSGNIMNASPVILTSQRPLTCLLVSFSSFNNTNKVLSLPWVLIFYFVSRILKAGRCASRLSAFLAFLCCVCYSSSFYISSTYFSFP